MRVQLFATCLVDTFFPETGEAVVKLLRHYRVDISYPKEQTCCGTPPNSAGYRKEARKAAEHFISVFDGTDPIVIPSGSCASMVKNHYPDLFKDDPKMFRKAEAVARRTFELPVSCSCPKSSRVSVSKRAWENNLSRLMSINTGTRRQN